MVFNRGPAGFGENDTQLLIRHLFERGFQQLDGWFVFLPGNEVIRLAGGCFHRLPTFLGEGFFFGELQQVQDF